MHRDGVDVVGRKRAVMFDVADARAFLGDDGSKTREAAGTVADVRFESAEPAFGSKTAFENSAKNSGVDVSSAQRQHDIFIFQLGQKSGETRGQRRRAGAFDHGFFQFNQTQNGGG